ncbi:hypothetical protein O1611_g1740 [Lasiodiplodia mahajangana]|uniref:Uncharacterized protein n=1 Tax=Lasiodiplodia mahajangana TaxID=1108764 RepID=A0ACC2JX58_9PEZI|nr:hypothetical protein O1611_g1740 [Lasiodiplodia mahajangana]
MPSELVYQYQQQTPINGTISGMARPGNETGYYYIPIANLPWHTSWQELKDHVRSVCSVEHVEINGDGTGGHVILKGRANFEAAFRLLNGGVFHDRALIADGRNVDSWVLVKRHVDGPTSMPQSPTATTYTSNSGQQTSFPTGHSSGYGEWPDVPSSPSYVMSPDVSTGPSYMMSPVMDSSSYYASSTMPEYTDSATLYGVSSFALEHSHATANLAMPYPSGPNYMQQHTPGDHYGNSYAVSHNSTTTYLGAVPTNKREIIIRQLQPWATERQIWDLIRYKAGSDYERLQKLDMPPADGQQGGNRGYVIATFESEEVAERVIKILNDYQYDGRVLEVKHANEGVSEHQSSTTGSRSSRHRHSHHSHHSHHKRHDEKIKKGKGKENSYPTATSGEKKSKSSSSSSSSQSDVVIAHGSSSPHV